MLELALECSLYTRDPEAPAIVVEARPTRVISYGQLCRMVDNLREQLRALGIRPGYFLPAAIGRTPEALALMLAAALEGAAFTVVEASYGAKHLRELLDKTKAVAFIMDDIGAASWKGSFAELQGLPFVQLPVDRERCPLHVGPQTVDESVPRMNADGKPHGLTRRESMAVTPGAACGIFTSGSTGRPKCIMSPGSCYVANAYGDRVTYGMNPNDRILHMLPTFGTAYSLDQAYSTVLNGAALHILSGYIVSRAAWLKEVSRIVDESKITGFHLAPGLFHWMVEAAPEDQILFGADTHMRFLSFGGAPAPAGFLEKLLRVLSPKVNLYKSYGLGEVSRITVHNVKANSVERRGCIGKAVPGVKVFIARDHDTVAPPGELGEVSVICKHRTMHFYLGDERLTKERVAPHAAFPGEMVVYTGDTGFMDEEGFLTIVGRTDRMFKRNYIKIFPDAIENDFLKHPDVHEAVAFGLELEAQGGRPGWAAVVAIVRAREGATEEGIKKWAETNLDPNHMPDDIRIWPDYPRTATAKPALPEVRRRYIAEQCPWQGVIEK